jgi:hypothetical protein
LICNDGKTAQWSQENGRWEFRHNLNVEANYLYHAPEVVDEIYGLSSIDSGEPLRITWIQRPLEEPEIEETYVDIDSVVMVGVAILLISLVAYSYYQKR